MKKTMINSFVNVFYRWKSNLYWKAKQIFANPARYYGDGGTIHTSSYLDVETNKNGKVVAIWFRCQPLPFKQVAVDQRRSDEMKRMYERMHVIMTGVEVKDGSKVS